MPLTLDQMRTYVRSHLDLEEDDLPNSVLDIFVREGSRRIERAEPRWPFYEVSKPLTLVPNQASVAKTTVDATLDQVTAIEHDPQVAFPPLVWIGFDALTEQQSHRPIGLGRPIYFSEWAGDIHFFPAADIQYTFLVHGYRRSADWVAGGGGAVPDLPEELHNTVALWAMAKAYAQQEDPELASLYERQFSDELNEFRRRLVITPHNQPLVLNGGATPEPFTRLVRPRFDWEVH